MAEKLQIKLLLVESLPTNSIAVLCPAIVFNILKFQGYEIGNHFIIKTFYKTDRFLTTCESKKIKLILPIDLLVQDKSGKYLLKNCRTDRQI